MKSSIFKDQHIDRSPESNEPSFLRKLRAENAGVLSDRQERPIARPKRTKNAEEDDGPTYVLEESNDTLSKAEYEALVNSDETSKNQVAAGAEATSDERSKAGEKDQQKQQTIEIGNPKKKRKLGKIVGTDEAQEATAERKSDKKPKKKTKAVKLSFGDDETG